MSVQNNACVFLAVVDLVCLSAKKWISATIQGANLLFFYPSVSGPALIMPVTPNITHVTILDNLISDAIGNHIENCQNINFELKNLFSWLKTNFQWSCLRKEDLRSFYNCLIWSYPGCSFSWGAWQLQFSGSLENSQREVKWSIYHF